MDPGIFLAPVSMDPVILVEDHALMPGLLGAVPIALDWLPPQTLLSWTEQIPGQPLHRRLRALLSQGRDDAAWAWYHARNRGANRGPEADLALRQWADKEATRLGIRSDSLLAAPWINDHRTRQRVLARGHRVTQELETLFSGLPQKPWVGPILVRSLKDGPTPLPPRPAMPIIALDFTLDDQAQATAMAQAMTDLTLVLSSPPPHGWPTWLRVGTREVAVAKALGEGPSPRRAWRKRVQMGPGGIRDLMNNPRAKADEALALTAPLLHTKRRHRFGTLLDLLRAGSPSEHAISVAYGTTIEELVANR